MEPWCKENFSEADFMATYGSPESLRKRKDSATADSVLVKFKKPLIKVKLKGSGFKPTKTAGPLYTMIPSSVFGGTSSSEKDKKSVKKRKGTTADATLVRSTAIPAMPEKEVVIKTYSELRPTKRRQVYQISFHRTLPHSCFPNLKVNGDFLFA